MGTDRPKSARARENRALTAKINHYHQNSRKIYGSPRIHKDLEQAGERIGVNRVVRLMKAGDIQSKMTKKFIIATDSKHTLDPAPDLLCRDFQRSAPDKA